MGFALVGVAVVVIGSVAGYQTLIPKTHVVRARLARLVVSRPGVKAYDIKATSAAEQPVAQSGLALLQAAAKRFPAETGIYSKIWAPAPKVPSGAGVIAFLLPSTATARSVDRVLKAQQGGPKSSTSNSLVRRANFTVSGVPGSAGAVYGSSAKPKSGQATPTLAVAAFRFGRVVALAEVVSTSGTQQAVQVVARNEAAHLRTVEPGFSLLVVTHPTGPSLVWGAGSLLLLLIVGSSPFGWDHWRRRRVGLAAGHG